MRDARTWLIAVDMSREGELADRSRVFGPLSSYDGPQSNLAFSDGVVFGQADAAAVRAGSTCRLGASGDLERCTPVSSREIEIASLDQSVAPARWRALRTVSPIPGITDPWELRAVSSDVGVLVQKEEDGQVRAYRTATGEPLKDDWLTAAVADACSRMDLGNHRLMLTGDLRYVVLSPASEWGGPDTTLPPDDRPSIREFAVEGKTYSRSKYGIYYERPSTTPRVFAKIAEPGLPASEMPYDAYSVDGEMLLLELRQDAMRLRSLDGGVRCEDRVRLPFRSISTAVPRKRYDSDRHRIFMWRDGGEDERFVHTAEIGVCVWDVGPESRQKAASVHRIDVAELFSIKGAEYVPKQVIGTAEAR
jgi:hypothetical protein